MERFLDPGLLWGMVTGLLTLGVAYGDLLVRSKSNSSRIEQVRNEHLEYKEEVSKVIHKLESAHAEHRRETTDRLARIETKIDLLIGGKT